MFRFVFVSKMVTIIEIVCYQIDWQLKKATEKYALAKKFTKLINYYSELNQLKNGYTNNFGARY